MPLWARQYRKILHGIAIDEDEIGQCTRFDDADPCRGIHQQFARVARSPTEYILGRQSVDRTVVSEFAPVVSIW